MVVGLTAWGVLDYYQANSGETYRRATQEKWVGRDNVRTERWYYLDRLT